MWKKALNETYLLRGCDSQNAQLQLLSFASFSFCAVPFNSTALLVIGGYSEEGALASVELLDTVTGRWEKLQVNHPLSIV